MAQIFDVAKIADEDAITVELRDGTSLHGKDLLPEVVDSLGQIVDRRAREDASDEVEQRRLIRVLQNEDSADDAYAEASALLTELTTRAAQRGRQLVYEQLAVVFDDQDGEPLTPEALQRKVPLPAARRIADALTRQILGRGDNAGEPAGNAGGGSDGAPTPTATTP